jgi:hypothetical protein
MIFLCFFALACNDVKENDLEKVIYVNSSSVKLFFGDEIQIKASPVGENFEWTTEDPEIATVTGTGIGLVKAVGIGETNIIVSLGADRTLIPVTVSVPVVDSVGMKSGKERIQFDVKVLSDRIKTIRVTLKNTDRSVDIDVNYQTGIFTGYFENLSESNHTFLITSFDKFDNESVPMEIVGYAYGSIYEKSIQDRIKASITELGNGFVINPTNLSGITILEVSYIDRNDTQVTVESPGVAATTFLGFKKDLKITTSSLPDPLSLDVFEIETTAQSGDFASKKGILSAVAPCEIYAGDFDLGGENVGYHDTNTSTVSQLLYRRGFGDYQSDWVNIQNNAHQNVGGIAKDEWLSYTVTVKDAGTYEFDVKMSTSGVSKYKLIIDGVETQEYAYTNNGAYHDYAYHYEKYNLAPPTISLTAGEHQIKYLTTATGLNLMAFKFTYKE